MLKKMRNNFESSGNTLVKNLKMLSVNLVFQGIPDQPKNVALQVSSANSLLVSFESPEQNVNIVTKYKSTVTQSVILVNFYSDQINFS